MVMIVIMQRAFATCLLAVTVVALSVAAVQPTAQEPQKERSLFFAPNKWQAQRAFEQSINVIPDPKRLRGWHDLLASEPHVAGTNGDQRVIDAIVSACRDMGLDVRIHEFWALLCEPVDAKLEIVGDRESASDAARPAANEAQTMQPRRRGVVALPVTEDNLLNDPFIAHPGLSFGWNAYSGSGDVTAGVVYANYGTKEDFETLKSLGIDCTGRIVLARYGGNYRGYKAKFAQSAGAAGLIIFTDPDDAGYRKGVPYPEGGWANDTCIQRGSIVTLDQPGDPLTPGTPATKDALRLDADEVDLPRIPVQPIGYRAAQQIMMHMAGQPLPEDLVKSWQGGLPSAYRLTGGDDLRLRLLVKQERKIKRSANVIATLRGSSFPDERILLGSHHDAWGFGAGDPTSGTIVVLEAARSFAELAARGERPARSIDFCFWGAEEFGIIGSTEYCEQFADDLRRSAVAYINLDGAAMGPNFSASSDPTLKTLIEEVARVVPQARAPDLSVMDAWTSQTLKAQAIAGMIVSNPARGSAARIGNLGGGSDHIGFYCHLGIPSCFLSSNGAPGTAYHSNYDNLAWYRQTVGEDYEPAFMLTRIVNLMAARLANADIPPLDPSRHADDLREHLHVIAERAKAKEVAIDLAPLLRAIDALDHASRAAVARMTDLLDQRDSTTDAGDHARHMLEQARSRLFEARQCWLTDAKGLPGRRWFRNRYAASDADSGYAAWMLPEIRAAIEQGDEQAAREAIGACVQVVGRLTEIWQADAAGANDQPRRP